QKIQPTFNTVQGNPGGCSGCHSWTYAGIYDKASSYGGSAKVIAPGDTSLSTMWNKVNNTGVYGGVMPPNPFSVSNTFKADLGTWIRQSACNN
ncbi:MAG: hypothetical protein ACKO2K_21005, partial [Alphaproteobacteria bacterium]